MIYSIDEVELNKLTCFQSNGSEENLVDVQHTMPDINAFKVIHFSII